MNINTPRISRVLKQLALFLIGLPAVILILIYIPPVQDIVVSQVLKSISDDEMQISVEKFRLSLPLKIHIDSLKMVTPGMEISTAQADADIAFWPLLKANVEARRISVSNAAVNIGTRDSSLYMRSSVAMAGIKNARVNLSESIIDVESLTAGKGEINIIITPDSVPTPPTESEPLDWKIALSKVQFEQIDYSMQMLPTIDSLQCLIPTATLSQGNINLHNSTIHVENISIDGVDATYITPTAEYIAAHPAPEVAPDTTSTSVPWTVTADKLRLTKSKALYATSGAVPSKNFDPLYINATDIEIAIDSLYNRGTEIKIPLNKFKARERCGISIEASGVFTMDSTQMEATAFNIITPASHIALNAMMGMEQTNQRLRLLMDASISPDDIKRLVPESITPIADNLPPYTPLTLEANVDGRMNNLQIHKLSAEIDRHLSIYAGGSIAEYTNINRADGEVILKGVIIDGSFIKPSLADAKTMNGQFNIPSLKVDGVASFKKGIIDGNLTVTTETGDVALDAWWNNRMESYDVNFAMHTFPIQSILPMLDAKDIDANVTASGNGIDFFSPETTANAQIALNQVYYRGRNYRDITLDANIAEGKAEIKANSKNRNANFNINANGNLSGETFNWTFDGNIKHINLYALAITDTIADGSIKLAGEAKFSPAVAPTRKNPGRPMTLSADVKIADLYWHMPGDAVNASDIDLVFNADTAHTLAELTNRNLKIDFIAPVNLDSLTTRFGYASLALDRDITRRRLSIDTLHRALPPFKLNITAGDNNILANYLAGSDISFKNITLNASNDSLLTFNALANVITVGETDIDTIVIDMIQRGEYLLYNTAMRNRPGTLDQFANVNARGYIHADRVALLFKQQNREGETGYSLGAMARVLDKSKLELRFVPYHPIIGYKNWEINKDNFISYNLNTRHIDANINLHSNESSVKLFSEHNHLTGDSIQEDIILKVKDIKLADWLAINPFAPPISGDLSTDMRIAWQHPDLNGTGTVSLNNFYYGKKRVGNFDLALDVKTNAAGTIRANTSLMVDGVKTITASGNLNDSLAENPFLLDFKMIRFPLHIANPFLPPGTADLSGVLNGEMDITGDMAAPVLNGFLDFDSAAINMDLLGTKLRFSEAKIPVENSLILFDNFKIKGINDNPLIINGTVDLASVASPKIDLQMKARDMQIVGSKKKRKSQVYGKAFIDLDSKIKGSTKFISVDADLKLLPGSNLTYVMADAMAQIESRGNQEMVKFVDFSDTARVVNTDTVPSSAMLMDLKAKLGISSGTTVNIELDPQGQSKVQLQSTGDVNYSLDYMNDTRFTGRININNGYVRYVVPVIGEKTFTFREDSYVAFAGDMLNPQLHIKAFDEIRANVSQHGSNSRVVNFNAELSVTGTLNTMDVVFDLNCPDDITIANELKSMSPEQRANQAMNLLLYHTYRSGSTQTINNGNAGTSALFNFLESQLNSWASSAIKGVDLSFGINQYDKSKNGANSSSMSYSYRVSKSLFDDRFKIVVGGNYTTDADADENFAQNLIADISFEYTLNKAGTMYIKLFRHTGYESILEGEITQTGVGFVYKKKIGRISDLFKAFRKEKPQHPEPPLAPTAVTDMPDENDGEPQKENRKDNSPEQATLTNNKEESNEKAD